MNYPPGVTPGMIPGWRKEDVEGDAEEQRLNALAEKVWPGFAEDLCESAYARRAAASSAEDVCDDAADVLAVADRLSAALERALA